MIEEVKTWLRAHAGVVMVSCAGALLAVSLLGLGLNLLSDDSTAAEAKAAKLISKLEGDLGKAEEAFKTNHEALLAQLPGVDVERVNRDRASGEQVLLSLIDSSATTRDVHQTQVALDNRYEFLTPTSRTLTEFTPEWMSSTGGSGQVYVIDEATTQVTSIQGLDYAYTGVARLTPVATGKNEYVTYTFTTTQNGTITSFEAYRTSSRSRDALEAKRAEPTASPSTETDN